MKWNKVKELFKKKTLLIYSGYKIVKDKLIPYEYKVYTIDKDELKFAKEFNQHDRKYFQHINYHLGKTVLLCDKCNSTNYLFGGIFEYKFTPIREHHSITQTCRVFLCQEHYKELKNYLEKEQETYKNKKNLYSYDYKLF